MPLIMTQNALVKCSHGGTGINIPSQHKVFVKGIPVLIDGDRGVIPDCTFPLAGGPPCASYELNSMKLNSAYIDGKNIMLVTDFIVSDTGFPLIITETHFVEDNTTPAPLKPGETPMIPPFLLNVVKPVVSAVPPSFTFKKSAPAPTMFTFTFTLNSIFPLKWQLTKLNKQVHDDIQDFTSNIKVTPKGGIWNSNVMRIRLNLEPTYMQTLIDGEHYFVMVGIDQRGNAGYTMATLVILPP